jgi:hypothetical protein
VNAAPVPDNAHIFIPVGIYYRDGKYLRAEVFNDQKPIPVLELCRHELQTIVEHIKVKGGNIPEGGDVIAACLPVLAEVPVR